jgi:hypothetical protein
MMKYTFSRDELIADPISGANFCWIIMKVTLERKGPSGICRSEINCCYEYGTHSSALPLNEHL